MKFTKLFTTILLASMSFLSHAEEIPGLTEGKDYTKMAIMPADTVIPTNSGKIAVVEFFWYGCPHCFKIKPLAETILKKYENKATVIKYPVGIPQWESAARMFFTYQEMNVLDKMHDKTFNEIHGKHDLSILNEKLKRNEFLKQNNIDVNKFNLIYTSPTVNSKWTKATSAIKSHQMNGAPNYAVYSGGYVYQVSPALVASYEKTAENLDKIIAAKLK